MYDKVTAWIDRYIIGSERFEELRGLDDGRGWQIWGSMHLSFYENTIKCTGSLNKWRDGQNIVALTFAEVAEVVSDFCNSLGVQPSEVRVSGLEFGATMHVSQHPARYMELLGEASRKKRLPTLSGRELQTVYYMSEGEKKLSCFVFYDKGVESKRCENLLRFEIRYHKQLSQQLYRRSGKIWLSTLCEVEFFDLLREQYIKKYEQVKKMGQTNTTECDKLTVSEGYDMIMGQLLCRDSDFAERIIAQLKRNGQMRHPKNYSELKGRINKTLQRWGAPADDAPQLLDELRTLIDGEVERCRPLV